MTYQTWMGINLIVLDVLVLLFLLGYLRHRG